MQTVEDAAAAIQSVSHTCNARILRARLRLQTGGIEDALMLTEDPPPVRLIPSWRGEHFATRALALACAGDADRARLAATEATSTSRAVEVTVLAESARAVSAAQQNDVDVAVGLMRLANAVGAWDPVVCACRASVELADALSSDAAVSTSARTALRGFG